MPGNLDASSVQTYLRRALGEPGLVVADLRRIVGGASRHTWIVDARLGRPGHEHGEGFVLRMDPEASVLESGRHTEYTVYRALGDGKVVPVPEVVAIEDDPSVLGQTFFTMRRVEGTSSIAGVAALEAGGLRAGLVPQLVAVMAGLRRLAPGDVPLPVHESDPGLCWEAELDRWEAVVRRDELEPQLATHAALRWLRRHPPKPADALSLLHGDLRTGNYLYDQSGRLTAVLDWEMAHFGDPMEDLGWFCARPWRLGGDRDGDVGSLCPRHQFVSAYEEATGVCVDEDSLRWWELLGLVKLNALFMTGGAEFAAGRTRDPRMAMMSISMVNRMDGWLVEEMGW